MSKKSKDVVITAALRTPIGTYEGSLKDLSAAKLGSLVIKDAIDSSKIKVEEIDEVIMGHVLTSGLGQNTARQAAIQATIPVSKPAHIINQVCGSGLRSVVSGARPGCGGWPCSSRPRSVPRRPACTAPVRGSRPAPRAQSAAVSKIMLNSLSVTASVM